MKRPQEGARLKCKRLEKGVPGCRDAQVRERPRDEAVQMAAY
jgi:hypothetical protein